jgi:hypothetical protein
VKGGDLAIGTTCNDAANDPLQFQNAVIHPKKKKATPVTRLPVEQ